jgi:transketolase
MALGLKIDGKSNRVYAIIGDGESDEGQIWETAMFAAAKEITNITAFTDYNKQQLDGYVKDILDLGDLTAKWKAFGWFTQEVDGHDIETLDRAIDTAQGQKNEGKKPSMIIMNTIKGKGCNFAEGIDKNHSMTFNLDKAKEAIAALEEQTAK